MRDFHEIQRKIEALKIKIGPVTIPIGGPIIVLGGVLFLICIDAAIYLIPEFLGNPNFFDFPVFVAECAAEVPITILVGLLLMKIEGDRNETLIEGLRKYDEQFIKDVAQAVASATVKALEEDRRKQKEGT